MTRNQILARKLMLKGQAIELLKIEINELREEIRKLESEKH
jgi:hypothetical protein